MADYVALRVNVTPCNEDITDLLAAHLADAGYESFVADEEGLTAYIVASDFSEATAGEALKDVEIDCTIALSHEFIKGKDWNEEWEKHYFQPIAIESEAGGRAQCVVHSSFHKDVPEAEYDIVVDPKMAFGTGHHSTTNLMLRYLLDMDLEGRSLIDMGSGTAILAILAAMRGAHPVTGIEIDPGAWENAKENVELNRVDAFMLLGDVARLAEVAEADVFLANINRNIILADLGAYREKMKPGGIAIFSGFYRSDMPIVEAAAMKHGLHTIDFKEDKDWVAVRFRVG